MNSGEPLNIVNVYAPNDPITRRGVWRELRAIKESNPGLWVFLGDFNDVRCEQERLNSEFVQLNAAYFNDFITETGLQEYNQGVVGSLMFLIMGPK